MSRPSHHHLRWFIPVNGEWKQHDKGTRIPWNMGVSHNGFAVVSEHSRLAADKRKSSVNVDDIVAYSYDGNCITYIDGWKG